VRARRATLVLALACVALTALPSCGEPPERPATPPSDRPGLADPAGALDAQSGVSDARTPSSSAPPSPDPRPPSTTTDRVPPTCIRGGSTRDEVLQVMGPPDSIVFGAYVYGRSQILFGYGVVQEWSNAGANLILC